MSRHLRNQVPEERPVSSFEVEPHRYTEHFDDWSYLFTRSLKDFREGCPYKAGQVVYVEHNGEVRKALISMVFRVFHDGSGDPVEKFRVHLANKTGDRFAKNWFYTFPGPIQRGYELMEAKSGQAA